MSPGEAPALEARVNVGPGRRHRAAKLGKGPELGQGNLEWPVAQGAVGAPASSYIGHLDLAFGREDGLAGEEDRGREPCQRRPRTAVGSAGSGWPMGTK